MTEETRTYPSELPLVPLREMVVFPKIVQPLGVGREKSVAAINAAMGEEKHYVIFAAQKDAEVDDVTSDQIYGVATVAEIVRLLRIPDGSAQVIVQMKAKIQSDVQQTLDKTQREYILREQMKAIQKELGDDDGSSEVNELREKIEAAGMPDEVKEKALKEVSRLEKIPQASPEQGVIRTYVDWLISVPWKKAPEDDWDIAEAARILDEDHYGLPKIKDRIIEYMALRKLSHELRAPILCFVGPPGVGKTSLGKSIARAMGRKFVRMSLGGIRDEAEIRGHPRTYVGALPGRILPNMKTAAETNPAFMLDE